MARLAQELLQFAGGQRAAALELPLGDSIDRRGDPIGGQRPGPLHAGEDCRQLRGIGPHQLLPGPRRFTVPGPIRPCRTELRQRGLDVRSLAAGHCRQGQRDSPNHRMPRSHAVPFSMASRGCCSQQSAIILDRRSNGSRPRVSPFSAWDSRPRLSECVGQPPSAVHVQHSRGRLCHVRRRFADAQATLACT